MRLGVLISSELHPGDQYKLPPEYALIALCSYPYPHNLSNSVLRVPSQHPLQMLGLHVAVMTHR